MSELLLDINVLIAMVWPVHSAHERVERWLSRHADAQWATCPFTEAGLVRVLSNPAFSPDALSVHDAVEVLSRNVSAPSHRFWPDAIGFKQAVEPFRDHLAGHQQLTDAYLLGLAVHHKGKLVTMDRGILNLLPPNSPHRSNVEVIAL